MKRLTDPASGMHPVHTRIAMLHLAGMNHQAIALFLGTSGEVVGNILKMPKVQQYTAGLRATMVSDVRRIANELNEKLETTAVEALDAQLDIMRVAKDECLDPSDSARRWEAGRLAVASAQDILSRTVPKPQADGHVEHHHSHLHAKVPEGFLDAVRQLDSNGHTSSSIIDITEPGSGEPLEDPEIASVSDLIERSPE
jgi:hypothetical protein